MKGAWETGSSNDKLLQVVREIELCIFRNASTNFPAAPMPEYYDPEPGAAPADEAQEHSEGSEGSSPGELDSVLGDQWAWSISGDGEGSSQEAV